MLVDVKSKAVLYDITQISDNKNYINQEDIISNESQKVQKTSSHQPISNSNPNTPHDSKTECKLPTLVTHIRKPYNIPPTFPEPPNFKIQTSYPAQTHLFNHH